MDFNVRAAAGRIGPLAISYWAHAHSEAKQPGGMGGVLYIYQID